MTAQAIQAFKNHVFEFCQQEQFTKQQTIAMTILAFYQQGLSIVDACKMVVGERSMAEISDVDWTEEELLKCVCESFVEV